jgi:NAD(P)-dependent dehydrogenase (short-subunit alcohol dehydrogenase family)
MNSTQATTSASLQGKTVVVIGGSSNIGLAVAEAAAAEGASIVIGSSSRKRVTAALERLPRSARGLEVDVTDEASVAGFFAEAGPLDHLAFTAGEWIHASLGSPAEVDLDRLRDIASVRVFGFLRAVKYGVRQIAPDGSVTFTGGAFLDRPQRGSWHIARCRGDRGCWRHRRIAAPPPRTIVIVVVAFCVGPPRRKSAR